MRFVAFLVRAGLDTNKFVGSNTAIAAFVGITCLAVYGLNISFLIEQVDMGHLVAASAAAFAGVAIGTASLQKITMG